MSINPEIIRPDFPPLSRRINGKPPVYFDNACVTLKPLSVIRAIEKYYNEFPACHGRSLHCFGEEVSQQYNLARERVRKFIKAKAKEEVIFVRNTTEGINLLANIVPLVAKTVLISELEHNSNLLPWQRLKETKGVVYNIFKLNKDLTFSIERFKEKLNKNVGLVSIPHVSNVTGVVYPIEEISDLTHENGALLVVDGAQAACSSLIDVQKQKMDFYVFSAHKIFGPSGIGCLYGRKGLLDSYPPFLVGGETVIDARFDSFIMAQLPDKYEAGLQDYAGAMGLKAAIDYLEKLGVENIKEHINKLNSILSKELAQEKNLALIGPSDPKLRSGIFNFYIKGVDSFLVGSILNRTENIMVRYGKHCAHAWYNERQMPDSIRASFSVYNTPEEITIFLGEIKRIIKYYQK